MGMRISRRTLLRAGASTGLLAVLAACGDTGVHSQAADKNGTTGDQSSPSGVGKLPAPAPDETASAAGPDHLGYERSIPSIAE